MNSLKKILSVLFLFLISFSASSQIVINEFCAANMNGYLDNYGDDEDWIELYNPTGSPIDISGYYVSDDNSDPTKWQIPAGFSVPAYGYQIIFADGRDEGAGGFLHTSFKISQGKQEFVVISDAAGNIIDEYWLEIPSQLNHSRGRVTDGAAAWGVFTTPTPGAANNGALLEYAATPQASVAPGFYSAPVNVTLSTPQSENTIYYTLNGDEPTAASTQYSGPINISTTSVLRAICINSNPQIPPGFLLTNTYFINVSHSVPVVSISGNQLLTLLNGTQIEPIGHFELFGADGVFLAEAAGDFNEHGNDSWAYPQRGVDYITQDEMGYNHEVLHEIFPNKDRSGYQRLILKAAASDNYPFETGGAHIRDAFVQSLSQVADLRMDERTYEPCILYANGQYWGVYEMREKVDDIDFTDHYYDQSEKYVDYIKTWGGTWEEYGSMDDWEDLRAFILGNDMTDDANYQYVKSVYNTGSLIDYFILNSYVVCSDWLNWNTGWWRGRNPDGDKKKWRYTLWDMDATFGHYNNFTNIPDQTANADICDPDQLGDPGGQGHVPIWNKLLTNENFLADYINRFADLSNSYFSCDYMNQYLNDMVDRIAPEMPAQIDRWGGTMAEWEQNVQNIRDFIDMRCQVVNASIVDCYDVEGPYELTLLTEPPMAGAIELNWLELTDFPWTGEYFGGVDQELAAIANPGFTFSHWTSGNAIIEPDSSGLEILLNLSANDTVIAHFIPDVYYDVIFNVEPALSGEIDVNGTIINSYPSTVSLQGTAPHNLIAMPSPGFALDYWELANHTLLPSNTDLEVVLTLAGNETITAHFYEVLYEVTFDVFPPGSAEITIDDQTLTEFPQTLILPGNVDLIMKTQTVEDFFEFEEWQLLNNTVTPDNLEQEVIVNFTTGDHIIAKYRELPHYPITLVTEPAGAGKIRFDETLFTQFPHTEEYEGDVDMQLQAFPENEFKFTHWEIKYNSLLPNDTTTQVDVSLIHSDTIIAHFKERVHAIYIPNSFTPNGDGVNDNIRVYGLELDQYEYRFTVFDRWGQIVFDSYDINDAWNGSHNNGDYFLPIGVYVYRLYTKNLITGVPSYKHGNITLIR